MVLVRERKEEARMIRGGGRSRKAVDAKEEGEEEDSSECADAEPEVDQTLTPTTPSGLQSSVQYLQAGQVPGVRRLHHDGRYRKSPSTQHFQPPENKDNYHNPQADYAMPVEISPVLEDISNHASSGHVFNEGAFAENSYGTIQDIHSHPDMFPPDEQQMIGHWAISATPELYPMHYNGEPSQTPALHPPNGEHIFGAYAYDGSRKHPYRNSIHGYSTNTHGQFQIGYEDDLARFQRINSCSFPVNSSNKFHPASTTQQPSYELPSHVRD